MPGVIIGVDPHKLSATIEVVDHHGHLLGSGRFTTDKTGYTAMRNYVKTWPEPTWAVEGANGAGRPLAQRLVETPSGTPSRTSPRRSSTGAGGC
jgi:transposase